ncbi:hypothetical protein ACLEQD_26075, partial [Corallococcus sp. 4LFB]
MDITHRPPEVNRTVSAVPPASPTAATEPRSGARVGVPTEASRGTPTEAAPEAPFERRLGLLLLAGALGLGAAFRLYRALHDDGIYWPDEVYQSLEPAHRLVYGYGLVAWEFVEGARNWALPALVAGLLGLGRLVGLTDPAGYLGLVKAFFAG